jgi:hypothetical protein
MKPNRIIRWSMMLLTLCLANIALAASSLSVNQELRSDQYLASDNGKFRLYMQGDGNLVLRDWATRNSLWSSGTHGKGGIRVKMQSDGNLVMRNRSGSAVWSSKTAKSGAIKLVMQDDGNLVLYTSSNRSVWSTGTAQSGGDTPAPAPAPTPTPTPEPTPTPTPGGISHIGTTQVWDSNGQGVTVSRPSGTRSGDLMVLVLHRTDDHLPFAVSGWTRGAECYKEDNGYQCLNVSDCTSRSGNFCDRFQGKYTGRDLAQVVFYKRAGSSEPSSYSFNMNKDSSGHPGWAILTTLRGANTSDPIRDTANRGCDKNADSLFPSVYGRKGDMLLLSQSYDDRISQSNFGAPSGMSTFGYVSNSDEAGFLFGGILDRDGETGERKTSGNGGSSCKDALVSVTIKAQ